ncbi:MAG TPA: AMP-binding protein [Steroidobacteraceae bacterium]|jgi:acyl-CoA synthetase (AMP-forming)/AMP-acid ligase II
MIEPNREAEVALESNADRFAMRLIDYFDRGVSLDPERPCLVMGPSSQTYREVQARSHRIGKSLIASGFACGEKAAVVSPNCAAAFECVLGILRAEGVWVKVNFRNAAAENASVLDQLDTTVLYFHSTLADQVAQFRVLCPKIRTFICIDGISADALYLEDWIANVDGLTPERGAGSDTLASLSSTGGTTGRPKGVMASNLTWQTFIGNFHTCFPMRGPQVHLVVAPMAHAAGSFALVMTAVGATNVILPRFDAEAVMTAIARYRVTTLFLPPTAIYTMLSHPKVREFDYSSLQYFFYTAAPMSVAKLREAIDVFGPVMTTMFGQVEAPATCTYLPPWELVENGSVIEKRLASCGRPSLHTRVAIMDDHGKLLDRRQTGEIVVRGTLVMRGYYQNPEATADASRFGWHHTGDVGYLDEDGYLFIVDRKKDMIISGGFNVYSAEVEQVLASHPAVHECAVIGVPDEKWGEAVSAVVELKPGQSVTAAALIEFAKVQLGSIKAPKRVEFWATLPRSIAGKVLKGVIREQYWKDSNRRI